MGNRTLETNRLERGFLPGRDNVPSNAASREVVESRKALCKEERRLKGRRRRNGEYEVLCHGGHGTNGLEIHQRLLKLEDGDIRPTIVGSVTGH